MSTLSKNQTKKCNNFRGFVGSGGGTRTPDTRIMIPELTYVFQIVSKTIIGKPQRTYQRLTTILSNQSDARLVLSRAIQKATSTFGADEKYRAKCQQFKRTEWERSRIKFKYLAEPKSPNFKGAIQ